MLICSFKVKWYRVVGWIVLIILLVVGGYFLSTSQRAEHTLPKEGEVKAWQV